MAGCNDLGLRENFIERLFAMKRWQDIPGRTSEPRGLWPSRHREKLLVMSHSPKHASRLGALAAKAGTEPFEQLRDAYLALLTEALRLKATPAKHVNVLQSRQGYFKRALSADEEGRAAGGFRPLPQGARALVVPVTLLKPLRAQILAGVPCTGNPTFTRTGGAEIEKPCLNRRERPATATFGPDGPLAPASGIGRRGHPAHLRRGGRGRRGQSPPPWKQGITYFDSAPAYAGSEAYLGAV
jgi:uncharacterized protein YbgA (DUF1722 family)